MSSPIEPATLALLPSLVDTLAPGFFGIVGVLAGGYLSHKQMVTQRAADAESEKRTRRRERLEELYLEFDRWTIYMAGLNVPKLRVMRGEITHEDGHEITNNLSCEIDVQRLFMIAEIYFQDADDQLSKVEKARGKLYSIKTEFESQFENYKMSSDDHAIQMSEALNEFDQCCSDYKSAIVAHARELI